MHTLSLMHWGLDSRKYTPKERLSGTLLGLSVFFLAFVFISLIDVVRFYDFLHHKHMPFYNPHLLFIVVYLVLVAAILFLSNYHRSKNSKGNLYLISATMGMFYGVLLSIIVEMFVQGFFAHAFVNKYNYSFSLYVKSYFASSWCLYAVIVALLVSALIIRWRMKLYRLNVQRDSSDTSSNVGSARMASENDITNYGLRGEKGSIIGKDHLSYLRMPTLTDRLILAYRGGGKTSSVLIPFILDHSHVNKLMTDIKGELASVTADTKQNKNRKIYIVDPFEVLKTLGVEIETHSINPLAYLNHENELVRDRYIAALASALCSGDHVVNNGTEAHFMENAQIIIEGILDYYTQANKDDPAAMNLVALHDWWLEVVSDKKNRALQALRSGSSKAQAAFAQLTVAGKDEAGSMKTTIYRQLQWLRSSNIRKCFLEDEVNIADFVSESCDIYVVLPEDMVKTYSRMVRMLMALIKVQIIQAPPSRLKDDYCFILDELGQFGYCPDVEQIIATLRARGVKVWASFTTVGQIDVYQDEATFKGMPVKHFMGSDDLKTLDWIQRLGSKTTVLTEHVSRSVSNAGKSVSSNVSDNYSVSETATDLIHFNHVREMPEDEQFVFIKGMRPILCDKAYYYKEAIYDGRYNTNPIEERAKGKVSSVQERGE